MEKLKKRSEFLAVAATRQKYVTRSFVLQVKLAEKESDSPIRMGYTVSRKVGNAVERNRVKRRLRELARRNLAGHLPSGDYVLIGRRAGLNIDFRDMLRDGERAIEWVKKQA